MLIALLTDFGLTDAYTGVLHGVIAGIAPQVRVIDLTHQLPPGDVRRAAFTLWQVSLFFQTASGAGLYATKASLDGSGWRWCGRIRCMSVRTMERLPIWSSGTGRRWPTS